MIAVSAGQSEQKYSVSGNDTFRIGTAAPATSIAYAGTQNLTIDKSGTSRRFIAEVTYVRVGNRGRTTSHARFVQELNLSGDFSDRADDDPDFLTVLNQPFAVQLDATTMRELRSMRGSIPFQAQSPFGGAMLHGTLRPVPAGRIGGHSAVGVRFSAAGPMSGVTPQHPEASIAGAIRMTGTAYYATESDLLLALDATIAINGKLTDRNDEVPVNIVYQRTIRADDANASQALHRADEFHFQRMQER
ncbi:MAG: hypothetical protein M3R51_04085 [Candidatus Eremiobacteraeota bacterium]|nr:hypothetical protein [Candidatus Eremiobacteraeota bacterium]